MPTEDHLMFIYIIIWTQLFLNKIKKSKQNKKTICMTLVMPLCPVHVPVNIMPHILRYRAQLFKALLA